MRNCLYELYSVDAEYVHVVNNGLIEAVAEKKCALCGLRLQRNCPVNLCTECVKYADCCIGLEDIKE
jgi:hypothetical protein